MKLFRNIVIFLILVKLLDLALFYTMNYFYTHTYAGQDGGDLNKYLQDPIPPELVILGSSTARFQVNPDSFPVKACNIARAMTEDSYQLGVISVMIKNNKTPKNILLSLWPANYVLDYKKDEAPEDVLFLKYYYNQVPYVKRQVNKISRFENLKYLFASYKFNSKIFDILKYYRISHDEKNKDYYFTYEHGVAMDTTRLNILPSSTKTSARDGQFPLSAYSTKFLPALADTCKKYGINLMCYYMPRFYTDTVRIKQGLDFIRQTMQQKNVPYFEFSPSDNPEFFEHKSWWADGLHLNEEGGKLQSSILSRFASPYIKR